MQIIRSDKKYKGLWFLFFLYIFFSNFFLNSVCILKTIISGFWEQAAYLISHECMSLYFFYFLSFLQRNNLFNKTMKKKINSWYGAFICCKNVSELIWLNLIFPWKNQNKNCFLNLKYFHTERALRASKSYLSRSQFQNSWLFAPWESSSSKPSL